MIPLRRKIGEGAFDILKIKEHEKDINVALCMADFLEALKNV